MEDNENRLWISLEGAIEELQAARLAAVKLPWTSEKERLRNGKLYADISRLVSRVQSVKMRASKNCKKGA